jgi:hypothetical protein
MPRDPRHNHPSLISEMPPPCRGMDAHHSAAPETHTWLTRDGCCKPWAASISTLVLRRCHVPGTLRPLTTQRRMKTVYHFRDSAACGSIRRTATKPAPG